MCYSKTIGRKSLEYFQFVTILSNIEQSINSCPLTYVDTDNNLDFLTPNHFLKLISGGTVLHDSAAGSQLQIPNRVQMAEVLEKRDDLLEKFNTQWVEDYLVGLRENQREIYQKDWPNSIREGDVRLLYSLAKSRAHWQMGRV